MIDEASLTAHHEAGHAVAALLRGEDQLRSITIQPTHTDLGYTGLRCKPCDVAFITYAGPWAEARARWPLLTLEGDDDDGSSFEDYVAGAFLLNAEGDGKNYQQAQQADAAMYGPQLSHLAEGREAIWCYELERAWPTMQRLAAMLLDGPVSAQTATQLIAPAT